MPSNISSRPVGAHLSSAGGINNAIDKAVEIGATAVQVFSGSPRSWARKEIDPQYLQSFQKYGEEHGIRDFFVHTLYLTNLGSEKTELVQKTKNALIYDLKFAKEFGGKGVVVHLGSHLGMGWDSVVENMVKHLRDVIDEANSPVPLLLENSAGQQGKLCSDLNEIRILLDGVDRPTLGWCYDTCHGWAAGYTVAKQEGGQDLFAAVEKLDLWDSLVCIHFNDSRDPFMSGRDRHANIFEGTIAKAELEGIVGQEKWANIPLITEVPGFDDKGPDAENIKRIRSLLA